MKVFQVLFRDKDGKQRFETFPALDEERAVSKFAEAFAGGTPDAIWDRTMDYITDPMTVFKALRTAGFSREKAEIIALLADSIE